MPMEKNNLIKSPMNYTGGKFKLLNQIIPLFPERINRFIDLFCGGCSVGLNVNANKIIFNDSLTQLIELYKKWQKDGSEKTNEYIENRIKEFSLSKTNSEGYIHLRSLYNTEKDIRDLFVLIAHSFNNQIRFNSKGEFNMPFGKNRSDYNNRMKSNLIEFINEISKEKYLFTNFSFDKVNLDKLSENDFIYCDPPYLITLATYSEKDGWNEKQENKLYSLLDEVNKRGIKFALSNVLENKGKENLILKEWSKKYNVHHLNMTYGNCSYHAKDKTKNTTDEVLITNY